MENTSIDTELIAHKESGWLGEKRYNVGKLFVWARERFPVEEVDVAGLVEQISGFKTDSSALGNIDPDKPILLSNTNHVIDGRHRIYNAFIKQRPTIKVIRLPEVLPADAEL